MSIVAKILPGFRPSATPNREFSALSIPNCVCWTRFLTSTLLDDLGAPVDADSDRIGTAIDQSGNGHNFEFVFASNRCPLYKVGIQNGLPMALFDGSNDYLACDALAAYLDGSDAAITVAVVIKKVTNTSGDTVFAGSSSSSTTPVWQAYTATNYGISKRDDAANLSNPTAGATDTSAHVLIYRFNGTTVDMWVDGTQIMTASGHNVGVLTLDRFALGAWVSTSTSQYHDGYIGEFVMYDGALSAGNISLLQTGLRARWNV